MNVEAFIKIVSIIAGASSLTVGAISGGIALFAKANELRRNQAEKRQQEIHRLLIVFEKNRDTFSEIIDYVTPKDNHLRITNLARVS